MGAKLQKMVEMSRIQMATIDEPTLFADQDHVWPRFIPLRLDL